MKEGRKEGRKVARDVFVFVLVLMLLRIVSMTGLTRSCASVSFVGYERHQNAATD